MIEFMNLCCKISGIPSSPSCSALCPRGTCRSISAAQNQQEPLHSATVDQTSSYLLILWLGLTPDPCQCFGHLVVSR